MQLGNQPALRSRSRIGPVLLSFVLPISVGRMVGVSRHQDHFSSALGNGSPRLRIRIEQRNESLLGHGRRYICVFNKSFFPLESRSFLLFVIVRLCFRTASGTRGVVEGDWPPRRSVRTRWGLHDVVGGWGHGGGERQHTMLWRGHGLLVCGTWDMRAL